MGQKVNPISNRLGYIRGWESNWFGGKNYAENLLEDVKIRNYLKTRLANANISRIYIERLNKIIIITIKAARPGLIIGRGGKAVDQLREELKKITDNKDVQINIDEVKLPETDAVIVANTIAKQLEARIPYRRAVKNAINTAMRLGVKGIKVQVSGRLNGVEMARSEFYKDGRIPLHTFRADIDYAFTEAHTKVGRIGVKVWVFKGEIYGKPDLWPTLEKKKKQPKAKRGGRKRKKH